MRARRLLVLAALGALAAAATPVLAADRSVVALPDNTFAPRQVAVKPGETVTFTNRGGDHNVVWNDGAPAQPAQAVPPEQWPAGGVSRTFARTGRYRYYCELHAGRTGEFGMVGYVHVNAAGLLPPVLSSLSAAGTRSGVRLRFRASRAGRVRATIFRRSGRRYVRRATATVPARRGPNSRRVAHRLAPGAYRVTVQLTDRHGLRSAARSRAFAVR